MARSGEAWSRDGTERHALLRRLIEGADPIDRHALKLLDASTEDAIEELMVRLLPEAARYAVTPLSDFPVGAVLEAHGEDGRAIYVGANLEFRGQSPAVSIHAEQAAIINAWMHGRTRFRRIAVSSPPCGYCRQFLHEWGGADDLMVLVGSGESAKRWPLSELLPAAFGPRDLGVDRSLSATGDEPALEADARGERLVAAALSAARRSYAPYTGNLAGVCLETAEGRIFTGRGMENAAYNPSLSAMHVALAFMHLNLPLEASRDVVRAVLVEHPAKASQSELAAAVLRSWAPEITLEYHRVVLESPVVR